MNVINLNDASVIQLILKKGNDDTLIFTFKNKEDQSPSNLTGSTFQLKVLNSPDGTELASVNGSITGTSFNQVTLVTTSISNNLKVGQNYWYKLIRTKPDTTKRIVINGKLSIES